MTEPTPDDVPVPHYEDELWHTLAQVHADQRRARVPSSPLGGERARRRARRVYLVGAGSIAAAAVAVAAFVVTDDDSPSTETAAETTTSSTESVPEQPSLADRIAAANEVPALVYTRRDNLYQADNGVAIGDEEVWVDEQSGARRNLSYDAEGQPSYDNGRVVAPTVDDPGPPPIPPGAEPFDPSLPSERLRTVDHCFDEYKEFDQTAFPGVSEADQIVAWLEEGSLVEHGTEVVDGRELIRLVQVPADLQGGQIALPGSTTTTPPATSSTSLDPATFEYTEHIYLVDPETYRPVRIIGYPGEAPDYSDAMYIATVEYLPRTPENLAKLVAPAPAGYELVPELRGDGDRLAACGL